MENILQNRQKISVCMATYNGQNYIKEQLDTILVNLKDDDEFIISDDGSTDQTIEILQQYKKEYKQIIILKGPGRGVIKNFENALKHAKAEYIFLADQDDLWEKNKVDMVMNVFNQLPNKWVIVHDAEVIDGNEQIIMKSYFKERGSRCGLFKNFIKNSYVGCCMAVRREILDLVIPFPNNIEMHDWWIGLLSDLKNRSFFMEDRLIKYRRHNNNVSAMQHYPWRKMLQIRICFVKELTKRLIKTRKQ